MPSQSTRAPLGRLPSIPRILQRFFLAAVLSSPLPLLADDDPAAFHEAMPAPRAFYRTRTVRVTGESSGGIVAIRALELWSSRDAGAHWSPVEKPRQGKDPDGSPWAEFDAPQDGEYALALRARDELDNPVTPPADGEPPALMAVVDTAPPAATLDSPKGGESCKVGDSVPFAWTVKDDNLGDGPVTLEWSTDRGKTWETVAQGLPPTGTLASPALEVPAALLLVRLRALDLAGHEALCPIPKPLRVASPEGSLPAGDAQAPARSGALAFNIDYELSDADREAVSKVLLWYTADGGRSWIFYGRDQDTLSPMPFQAPGDGRYGFYLVVMDRHGNLNRPEPKEGSQPDQFTLVDTHPPVVKCVEPARRVVMRPRDPLKISWDAQDANLPDDPVAVYGSLDDGGTWELIARGLPARGVYTWELPAASSEGVRVKIQCTDRGRNVGEALSAVPLILAAARPKIRIKEIHKADGSAAAPPAAPTIPAPPADAGGRTAARTAFERATVQRARQDLEGARKSLEAAVQADGAYFEAWHDLGFVRYSLKAYAEAVAAYEKAHALNTAHTETTLSLGSALCAVGRPQESVTLLLPILSANPPPAGEELDHAARTLLYAARSLCAAGQAESGRQVAKQVLNILPSGNPLRAKADALLRGN